MNLLVSELEKWEANCNVSFQSKAHGQQNRTLLSKIKDNAYKGRFQKKIVEFSTIYKTHPPHLQSEGKKTKNNMV